MDNNNLRDNVSIEVRDDTLVSSIKTKMENISPLCCICRVSEKLHIENDKAYVPKIVSIGPFHHDKLKEMEDPKWRYLHTLLSRKPNLEASLDSCVISLRELEQSARKCYAEDINLTSEKFLEMMLVDGCFIIELFLKYAIKNLRRRGDPIFCNTRMFSDLRHDMILLENQIPFFVLQRLFNLVPIPQQCSQSLTELAFRFFKSIIPGDKKVLEEKFSQEGNHLLDLIHNCLLPTNQRVQPKQGRTRKDLKCANKLQAGGRSFKKATAESLLDIKFDNGVIEIPPLKIHHYTETLLRNAIALENRYSDCTPHVTSYVILMRKLICSEKDVRLLHRRQILTNSLESEKEVSELFKNLPIKETDLKDFYYEGLCEEINEYKRTGCHVWWRKVKLNNHKTHLPLVAFFVVILFLVLTFIGTLFSVLSFSRHRF